VYRPVPQPDARERDDAEQRQEGEQVLGEAQPAGRADQRDVEVALEQRAVALDQGQAEHQEAPERERVGQARYRPLEQLGLAQHLDQLRPHPGRYAPGAVRVGGLPAAHHPVQRQRPAPGEPERDSGHRQAEHHANHHDVSPCASRSR
jgi:hypothetical protein